MPWETYEPSYDNQSADEPRLTIYQNRSGYINRYADETWLDDHETIIFHADPGRGLLAIEPAGSDGDYKISRKNEDPGGDIATQYVLRDSFDIDEDDIDETAYLDLTWNDERGWAVADVSGLIPDESDADATDDEDRTGEESEDETPSDAGPEQGITSGPSPTSASDRDSDANESGKREFPDDLTESETDVLEALDQHGPLSGSDLQTVTEQTNIYDRLSELRAKGLVESQTDPDDGRRNLYSLTDDPIAFGDADTQSSPTVVDDGEGGVAVPDLDEAPSAATVRDCAEQVETLSDLANLLDMGRGKARLLARDAGVIEEIRDDQPRMGVGD
jgi:DNA-binding transcriptional ArsR family regulator